MSVISLVQSHYHEGSSMSKEEKLRWEGFVEKVLSFTSQPISVIISTLIIHHSFTLSLQAQNLKNYLFNKSFTPYTSFTYWTAFMIMGLDRTYHAHHFIFSLICYFFVYCMW